jgi:hypothetical protein
VDADYVKDHYDDAAVMANAAMLHGTCRGQTVRLWPEHVMLQRDDRRARYVAALKSLGCECQETTEADGVWLSVSVPDAVA